MKNRDEIVQKRDILSESWSSKWGFTLAAIGSAVGLANIWKFPYMVGKFGGGAFLIVYLLFLALVGFPVLVSEVLIGRESQKHPGSAFYILVPKEIWKKLSRLIILTGYIVSAYYACIAGWVMGYWLLSAMGQLESLQTIDQSKVFFTDFIENPFSSVALPLIFLTLSCFVIRAGVVEGLEKACRWLMPFFMVLLIGLAIWSGLALGGREAFHFMFQFKWDALTPQGILAALGHAFFTLSLGQGTMITYGSYLEKKEKILSTCFMVALADTLISLLAAFVVFSLVFHTGADVNGGPGLVFYNLPLVFNQLPFPRLLAFCFFSLLVLATITSEISALEPVMAYLKDRFKLKRGALSLILFTATLLLALPGSLDSFARKEGIWTLNVLSLFDIACTSLLIPLGGFLSVFFIAYIWNQGRALKSLQESDNILRKLPLLKVYFSLCFKYLAPIFIAVVFLNALGVI